MADSISACRDAEGESMEASPFASLKNSQIIFMNNEHKNHFYFVSLILFSQLLWYIYLSLSFSSFLPSFYPCVSLFVEVRVRGVHHVWFVHPHEGLCWNQHCNSNHLIPSLESPVATNVSTTRNHLSVWIGLNLNYLAQSQSQLSIPYTNTADILITQTPSPTPHPRNSLILVNSSAWYPGNPTLICVGS